MSVGGARYVDQVKEYAMHCGFRWCRDRGIECRVNGQRVIVLCIFCWISTRDVDNI